MKISLCLISLLLVSSSVAAQTYASQLTISQAVTARALSKQKAAQTIVARNVIGQKAMATYTAGQSIQLQPGFTAQAGSVFTASIGPTSTSHRTAEAGGELSFSVRAYPNPFRQTTLIEYVLPQAGQVAFTLTDEQGRILRQEIEASPRQAGLQEVSLTADTLMDGVYFYQIQVNGQQRVIRLLKTQ